MPQLKLWPLKSFIANNIQTSSSTTNENSTEVTHRTFPHLSSSFGKTCYWNKFTIDLCFRKCIDHINVPQQTKGRYLWPVRTCRSIRSLEKVYCSQNHIWLSTTLIWIYQVMLLATSQPSCATIFQSERPLNFGMLNSEPHRSSHLTSDRCKNYRYINRTFVDRCRPAGWKIQPF